MWSVSWFALRDRLPGWKFRRQHPIGRRIVDFACPDRKLAIELDGGQHALREEADERRSVELARRGYRVIRFWNNEVLGRLVPQRKWLLDDLECKVGEPLWSRQNRTVGVDHRGG